MHDKIVLSDFGDGAIFRDTQPRSEDEAANRSLRFKHGLSFGALTSFTITHTGTGFDFSAEGCDSTQGAVLTTGLDKAWDLGVPFKLLLMNIVELNGEPAKHLFMGFQSKSSVTKICTLTNPNRRGRCISLSQATSGRSTGSTARAIGWWPTPYWRWARSTRRSRRA